MIGPFIALFLLACSPSNTALEGKSIGKEKPLFTKHFKSTLFAITEHALYSVEILLDDNEYTIGKNVVGMVIHNAKDEDVNGAEITFVVKDLASGKNSPVTPKVTDKGNGLYIVSGLDLRKEGKWELTIIVKQGRIEDRVKFILPDALKARVPKGRYSP
jgi:hypothetical protein